MSGKVNVFEWIKRELKPRSCNSEELIYDDMESQSGRCLPIIYQPFDAGNRSHWCDRGSLFDYLFSTDGKRLLDFGPGDGWPSLMVAPYVDEVVGVEGSLRRVDVCIENAKRLGITNAKFIFVEPGSSLPFEDNSFDGVMVASSVEQTPDPKAVLRDLFRVLRSGGRMRMAYEALGRYRNGRERKTWLCPINDHTCRLILYDRRIDKEQVSQYGITFSMPSGELLKSVAEDRRSISFEMVTIPVLERLRSVVVDAQTCSLTHPSAETLVTWLNDVGFRKIIPSHSGAELAGHLFDGLSDDARPKDIGGVESMLRPLVKIAVRMAAPLSIDPMITAIK
jgi:ubiquinone/menaquinone biosynthesis C-methylase UbiE